MLFYAGTFLKCKKSQGSYTLVFINSIGLGFLEATDTVMYVYDVSINVTKFHNEMLSHC